MTQGFIRNDDAAARTGAILAAVAVVQLLVSLDLSIVNVALPDIADGLKFSASGLAWVIHAYALTFGGLLLLGGKSADVFGRRRMLVIGLAVFAGASLLAGAADTPGQLIAARGLQGVGATAMQPASLAVLAVSFPGGRARRVLLVSGVRSTRSGPHWVSSWAVRSPSMRAGDGSCFLTCRLLLPQSH